ARLAASGILVAPGAADALTARVIEGAGFGAVYVTGAGIANASLGVPDLGLTTMTELVAQAQRIADAVRVPVIVDADTGFGGPLNVARTVRELERAGAAAIQLEDQEFPKKCGHTPGRRVVPTSDMVRRIRVACDARGSADFKIIARTDARTSLGLDEALRRAEAYAKAGADLLFVESPESVEEMRAIGRSTHLPLVANMVEGGRTPVLAREELEALGYRLAIFPVTALLAATEAMRAVYAHLRAAGSSPGLATPLMPFADLTRLMGFEEVWEFDRRNAET
ncbi:MAG TPA: isocitrate lyase/PEP mutase family protein, partial [Burkholderiaceae bacterium]|nr:isocitrate lyase/PEP mutase family protein [Burkholderiaceae bacterium]